MGYTVGYVRVKSGKQKGLNTVLYAELCTLFHTGLFTKLNIGIHSWLQCGFHTR